MSTVLTSRDAQRAQLTKELNRYSLYESEVWAYRFPFEKLDPENQGISEEKIARAAHLIIEKIKAFHQKKKMLQVPNPLIENKELQQSFESSFSNFLNAKGVIQVPRQKALNLNFIELGRIQQIYQTKSLGDKLNTNDLNGSPWKKFKNY